MEENKGADDVRRESITTGDMLTVRLRVADISSFTAGSECPFSSSGDAGGPSLGALAPVELSIKPAVSLDTTFLRRTQAMTRVFSLAVSHSDGGHIGAIDAEDKKSLDAREAARTRDVMDCTAAEKDEDGERDGEGAGV